ncbi:MAG: hypothetical protein JO227_20515 [Acetobacteraceae bacterium]|nr:hypothetical protein [Acetobacteraceae bacterium]
MVFRVLVTDADTKHSISIQRSVKQAGPDIEVIAHSETKPKYAHLYKFCDRLTWGTPLDLVLRHRDFDMVVPVGGRSVLSVDAMCRQMAVLPSSEALSRVYDKRALLELARQLSVPAPQTICILHEDDLNDRPVAFPCVIKPAKETEAKFVFYPRDRRELQSLIASKFAEAQGRLRHGILVQEYVRGQGVGFFALYQKGSIRRAFMHRRLREWPPSGGASSAAHAIADPTLEAFARRILDTLCWNGIAMVEFKHDPDSGRYALMEVNGKFWGSHELSVAAGLDFAGDLVRVFRGEELQYFDAYDHNAAFAWPLDGDVMNILVRGAFTELSSYRSGGMKTNLGQSRRAEARKALVLPLKMVRFMVTGA